MVVITGTQFKSPLMSLPLSHLLQVPTRLRLESHQRPDGPRYRGRDPISVHDVARSQNSLRTLKRDRIWGRSGD